VVIQPDVVKHGDQVGSHNHSPRFYGLLDRFMPQWQSIKVRLDVGAEEFLNEF